jgi:iron complex transport system substrate-binding protein
MRFQTRLALVAITALATVAAWMIHSCGQKLSERVRGSETEAEDTPKRIAILSPSATQIVFALGAGHRVVGVTRYATFPPEAKKLVVLGGLADISYEQMTALSPDLIIAQNASESLEKYASARDISLVNLEIETKEDVYVACRVLGRRLGLEEEGEALARDIEHGLNTVAAKVTGLKRRSCFLSVDRNPGPLVGVLSTGRNTFLTQMVELAGGRNIFDDMRFKYPVISKETLLVRHPEVVLEFKPGMVSQEKNAMLKKDWDALAGLPAVENDRIYVINHDDALIPGLRMAEVAMQIARALHPEIDETRKTEVESHGN